MSGGSQLRTTTSSSRLLLKAERFTNFSTGKLVEVVLVQARISRSRVISEKCCILPSLTVEIEKLLCRYRLDGITDPNIAFMLNGFGCCFSSFDIIQLLYCSHCLRSISLYVV